MKSKPEQYAPEWADNKTNDSDQLGLFDDKAPAEVLEDDNKAADQSASGGESAADSSSSRTLIPTLLQQRKANKAHGPGVYAEK
jgi:hypothetical protein